MAVTTALVVGMAATAAGSTMSFMQAGKQRQAQRQAERDAAQAMADARKKLEINFYGGLGIQKEPYELEREALLSQGAQAIQAGVESERGAAPIAGRVMLAQQQGQAGVRSAMGQELSALEKLSAQEQSRLRDVGVNIDLSTVEGAQLAAANAQTLAAQANQAGIAGVVSLGQQAASAIPLFAKEKGIDPKTGLPFVPPPPPPTALAIPTMSSIMPSVRASRAVPALGSTMGMQTAANAPAPQMPTNIPWNFYTNQQNPFAQFYQNPSVGGQ